MNKYSVLQSQVNLCQVNQKVNLCLSQGLLKKFWYTQCAEYCPQTSFWRITGLEFCAVATQFIIYCVEIVVGMTEAFLAL